jgi:Cu2+-exporting ATPase
MHPEVIQDEPGSCPICGMDLVPYGATDTEENKSYLDLLHKMKVALSLPFQFS